MFIIRFIVALICVHGLFPWNAKAQIQVPGSAELLSKLRLNEGTKGMKTVMYAEINGSPFIFRNFTSATIITENDEEIIIPVRYDIYANEMHLNIQNHVFALRPEIIKIITTDSLDFIYSGFSKSGYLNNAKDYSYFIVQTNGKCKLLVKKELRIQDAESPKLYQEAKPAKFIHLKDSYFLKNGKNDAIRIMNKNDVLSVMNDKKEDIRYFMDRNKTNLKKIEDIQKLVSYYNSL